MKTIIPAIIAKNQREFDERFERVKFAGLIHLDIMDGKFVTNQSLNFQLALPRKKYQLHLMVDNPISMIKWVSKFATTVIFHIETCKDDDEIRNVIKLIKTKKKKVGIAINPKTKINEIKDYLKSVDLVLIMTVNPGKYGAKFLPSALKKIKELRKLSKRVKIGLDGGIDYKTIIKGKLADFFVSGSYLQNTNNSKEAVINLKKLVN